MFDIHLFQQDLPVGNPLKYDIMDNKKTSLFETGLYCLQDYMKVEGN